jgi:hypothetical protein
MSINERVGVLSRAEIERLVQAQLSGVTWGPFFEERTTVHKFGRMWVVHLAADRVRGPWIYTNSRGSVRFVDFTSPAQRLLRILALLVLLIGLALVVSRFYPKRWCGTEVTASGAIKNNICRDPEVSDPAIVALGVVVLATLGVFFTEISGFGLTFKRQVNEADANARESLSQISELQEIRRLVAETQGDFADANKRTNETFIDLGELNLQTEDRLTQLERAIREIRDQLDRSGGGADERSRERDGSAETRAGVIPAEPSLPSGQPPSPIISGTTDNGNGAGRVGPVSDGLSADRVLGYAAEYTRTRSTMVAGPDRSTRMEEIFGEMQSAVKSIQVSNSEITNALYNPTNDRGIRLTAYAYLIEHPVPDLVTPLVEVAASEDKPFGQYCALRAVNRLVKTAETRLTPELTTKLNEIAITAGRGTDRAREVASILAEDRRKPRTT